MAAGAFDDLTGSYTLAVETDVAEAPAFAQAGYTFDLAEDTDGSVARLSLGTVSATDPDGGSVTYSIAGGNAAALFEIDAASGELFYVGGGEDYETGSTSFELTVRASDGEQATDATVTVNVTDVEDSVEVNPPFAQTVSEPSGEDFPANPSTSGPGCGRRHGHGQDREQWRPRLVRGGARGGPGIPDRSERESHG